MDKELKKLFAEMTKAQKELSLAVEDYIRESRADAKKYRQETRDLLEQSKKENEKDHKRLRRELASVGLASGEIAEDLFRRNVDALLKKRGIIFDGVIANLPVLDREYDIVGINGSSILVVETKTRLRSSDVDHFIKKQLPYFKENYLKSPYFRYFVPKGHGIIAGLASLSVSASLEKYAEAKGLFVFTQNKDGGASIANSENFQAKVF